MSKFLVAGAIGGYIPALVGVAFVGYDFYTKRRKRVSP